MSDRVELIIPAATDEFRLRATIWEHNDDSPIIIIAPATGVSRGYYRAFAQFLFENGLQVITYDNRGIGESRPRSLKGFTALMQEWADKDLEGVINWISNSQPDAPLLLVGHSVGGQLLGFVPSLEQFRALLFVAVQTGYWGNWTGFNRVRIQFLWYVAIPLLSQIFGYFPAKLFGLGEDLPADVARQWAEWGRSPGYIFDHVLDPVKDNYRLLKRPLRAYSFTDDTLLAPKAAVEHLLTYYESADKEHLHLSPSDRGLSKIGHWGFFRETIAKEKLWPEAVEWLKSAGG